MILHFAQRILLPVNELAKDDFLALTRLMLDLGTGDLNSLVHLRDVRLKLLRRSLEDRQVFLGAEKCKARAVGGGIEALKTLSKLTS